jgi:RHS repeat-associated protein
LVVRFLWPRDKQGDNLNSNLFVYKYDGNDRLTNRWTPAKGNTAYAYSAVGNLTSVAYPVSVDVSFGWDAMNRCTNMVDAVGTTVYSYDAAGQLLTEDGPFASGTLTNTYANRMRVALALQQPTGYWTNGFSWDPAKRLTNVAMSAGSFSYLYSTTQHRLVTNLGLPNTSVITNGYDANARLLNTFLNNSSGTPLDSYAYVYDPANERTNVTRTDASTVAFKYDPIGQLTVADSSVNTEDRGYFYDPAWNLNRRTNNGVSSTFTVESRNELTNAAGSAITYDFNGNISGHDGAHYIYAYDDENRLAYWIHYQTNSLHPASGDKQTVFVYDGRGRLRQRYEYTMTCPIGGGGGTGADGAQNDQVDPEAQPDSGGTGCDWALDSITEYIYDGNRVIQERNSSNIPQVTYTRGTDLSGTMEGAGGIGGLLARSSGYSSGNWTSHNYYHADGNGNVTYLVNSSQTLAASYRYDPFGNLISSSGSLASANVYRFSSKEFMVNSGMYYYLYRFYDPNLQRWINKDPIDEAERLADGPNLYRFTGNDPETMVDPTGKQASLAHPGGMAIVLDAEALSPAELAAARAAARAAAAAARVACTAGDKGKDKPKGKPREKTKADFNKANQECIEECIGTLPTSNYGASFFLCVRDCLIRTVSQEVGYHRNEKKNSK